MEAFRLVGLRLSFPPPPLPPSPPPPPDLASCVAPPYPLIPPCDLEQLSRLMSSRPDPGQLGQDHPEFLEASTLALVFEERVRPRATGEAETEGGPEHLVSFEALMTWPDVQVRRGLRARDMHPEEDRPTGRG